MRDLVSNDDISNDKKFKTSASHFSQFSNVIEDKNRKKPVISTEYENFDFENELNQEEHNTHVSKVRKLAEVNEIQVEQLNNDIEFLHEKISNIQAKHHSDYLKTFNQFMETVKKDIKEKIEKMNEIEKIKEKNSNILLVIAERDVFKQEAIRLNLLVKTLNEQIEVINREKKFMKKEIEEIIKKWQKSEEYNRSLIVEMNNCVIQNNMIQKKLEIKSKELKETDIGDESTKRGTDTMFFKTGFNSTFNTTNRKTSVGFFKPNKSKITEFNETELSNLKYEEFKKKCNNIINQLKADLRSEKLKFQKTFSDLNAATAEYRYLEKIFIECVELVQKDIKNRKMMDNLKKKNTKSINQRFEEVYLNDIIGYENFQDSDKRKLILNFFLSNDVINLVHDKLFFNKHNKSDVNPESSNKLDNILENETTDFLNKKVNNKSNSIGDEQYLFHKTNFPHLNDKLVAKQKSDKVLHTGVGSLTSNIFFSGTNNKK